MKRLARVDLNLFQIFDAIYTKGGVSAAARHLNLSQSAISHALARLRTMFEDKLFVRQGNRLVPTATARAIAGQVRIALGGLAATLDSAGAFEPARSSREFRLGIRLAGEMTRFPELVARVLGAAPGASLVSATFRRRDLVTALANGDLDLAIDVELPPHERLLRAPLGADALVVAARKGHPLLTGRLDLKTYVALDHVVATARPHGPGLEDIALERLGRRRRVSVRCQHAVTAWRVVATSDRLFTLSRGHAAVLDAVWPMQIFDLPLAVDTASSFLYWHEMTDADPALAWLRATIEEVVGERSAE